MSTLDSQRRGRDSALAALLIAPDREIADQFTATIPETRAFQVVADLKAYPPQNTLDIRLRQLKPEVVLIDVASNLDQASELIQFLAAQNPPVQAVGLHSRADSEAVVRVLRAGASDFLSAPFDAASQKEVITRLRRLRQPETTAEVALGRIALFTAAKPGAGSSTLATHTAHAIRRELGKRVLLVDMDWEGGTAGFYLKLASGGSMLDALDQGGSLDAAGWASLVSHSNGVDVLVAPDEPHSEPIDPSRLHDVLEYSRMLYDWVILDAPAVFHRISLLSLSESDTAFLITSPDLASLHLARKAVGFLTQLGFGKDRYQVVVNRISRKDGIAQADIEKIFNSPVHACIPNEYFSLHRVISLGQPLAPDCELGRSIAALATRVAGAGQGAKPRTEVGAPVVRA